MGLATKSLCRPGWLNREAFRRRLLQSGRRRRYRPVRTLEDRETSVRSNWRALRQCAPGGLQAVLSNLAARPGYDVEAVGHADKQIGDGCQDARDVTLALQVFKEHDIAGVYGMFFSTRHFDFDFSGHGNRKLPSRGAMPVFNGAGGVLSVSKSYDGCRARPTGSARFGCDGQLLDLRIAVGVRINTNHALAGGGRSFLRRCVPSSRKCTRDGRDTAQTQ